MFSKNNIINSLNRKSFLKNSKNKRDTSGFGTATSAFIGGVIATSFLAVGAVTAAGGSIIPDDIDTSRSGICAQAVWAEDGSIISSKCVYTDAASSEEVISEPTPEETEEVEAEDKILKVYELHDQKLVITQKMKDHSDANIERKANGEELIPYPDGGWNIIMDISEHTSGFGGAMLSKTGDYSWGDDGDFSESHNSSGYSVAVTDSTGKTINLQSYVDGKLESINEAPSLISLDDDGEIHDQWHTNNLVSREGSPNTIGYYPSGQVSMELWGTNAKMHKEDGPAQVNYHENGEVSVERYFLNDKETRLDGPARINYNDSGERTLISYYVNNSRVNSKTEWVALGGEPDKWEDISIRQ